MDEDPLDAARGMCLGYVISGIVWVVLFGGAALLIAKCAP